MKKIKALLPYIAACAIIASYLWGDFTNPPDRVYVTLKHQKEVAKQWGDKYKDSTIIGTYNKSGSMSWLIDSYIVHPVRISKASIIEWLDDNNWMPVTSNAKLTADDDASTVIF